MHFTLYSFPVIELTRNIFFRLALNIIFLSACQSVVAQFPPPVGQPGTTAIYKDSSIIVGWAKTCVVERGYIDISDTNKTFGGSNKASYGNIYMTADTADGYVLALGDGGNAVLGFASPIGNGPGFDFAVFENSFDDIFLELAFVEVSSDGTHFVRFPAVSLTPELPQTSTFGPTDATKINNLAGKYRGLYGTPFDLEDLKDSAGIDLNNIIMVRIIDVIGCVQDTFATHDSQGHKVNDPWPTPFDTGGFDLDAVAVLHYSTEGVEDKNKNIQINLYPNPVSDRLTIIERSNSKIRFSVSDLFGKILFTGVFTGKVSVDVSSQPDGVYIASFTFKDGKSINKIIIKN